MALTLDHVVILVADLGAAIRDYAALGFTVQPGGTHADGATHNALVVFGDGSYLELIAFLQPDAPHRWGAWARRGHEGFIDFALLPDSVPRVVEAARGRGLAYEGPIAGGRLRPDGQRLEWQIGTPPTPDLPFLCGDLTPRALRVPEGDVRVHPNGVRGVAAVTVAVADLDDSLARYRALLGSQADDGTQALSLPGLGLRLAMLGLGPTALLLAAPGTDERDGAALRQCLATRGEGPIGLALRGPAGRPAIALPRELTHGAAFEVVPG